MDNLELYQRLTDKIEATGERLLQRIDAVEQAAEDRVTGLSQRVGAIERKDERRVAKAVGLAIGASVGGASFGAWLKSFFGN
jgi:hypothetical protein